MIFYSISEIIVIVIAAIILDRCIGDPRWLPHPVIIIGRMITYLERRLLHAPAATRGNGVLLTIVVTLSAFAVTWFICVVANWLHIWFGYVVQTWLIATTIAVRGLKDAAMLVYEPLQEGDLVTARTHVGYIVGRDTDTLDEADVSRAAIETVAENTVDAFVFPIVFALLGAAPLSMLYRATNTLDSMVGYNNEKYRLFGWASARWDDVLNYIPARLTGILLVIASLLYPKASVATSASAIRRFAHLHPSPNSGIPESAVAGALGIELGGLNFYGGVASDRARLGWPAKPVDKQDIIHTVKLMILVRNLVGGGLLCVLFVWIYTI